jgi:predicted ATP-grasp superfamily ATP-dependent carboligase
VLTAPDAVTVVHPNDKAVKAPVATTAAQLTFPVVVKPNVLALTIPEAVRAPVVAAPETVSVAAETFSAAETLLALNVPDPVMASQLISPVVVMLLVPS